MRVMHVSGRAVAILFTDEALPPEQRLASMVGAALVRTGHKPWPHVEAECFTAGDEALVIARPGEAPHPV